MSENCRKISICNSLNNIMFHQARVAQSVEHHQNSSLIHGYAGSSPVAVNIFVVLCLLFIWVLSGFEAPDEGTCVSKACARINTPFNFLCLTAAETRGSQSSVQYRIAHSQYSTILHICRQCSTLLYIVSAVPYCT